MEVLCRWIFWFYRCIYCDYCFGNLFDWIEMNFGNLMFWDW